MEWQVILAMVVAAPVLILPVAFIWYLNIGGAVAAGKETGKEEAKEGAKARSTAQ